MEGQQILGLRTVMSRSEVEDGAEAALQVAADEEVVGEGCHKQPWRTTSDRQRQGAGSHS